MTPYILLLLGLLFVWLEFYLPGGALAIAGVIFLMGALFSFYAHGHAALFVVLFFFATCILTGLVVWLAIIRIRKSSAKNTFFLSRDQEGFRASQELEPALIGKKGVTATECGPSGYVLIDKKRYPAICRGPYLDKGREVEVVAKEGAHLIITPVL